MRTIKLKALPTKSEYRNNGQRLEQIARYTLSGQICKADNRQGNDYGAFQFKSARATVCKGSGAENLRNFIVHDSARMYGYIIKDGSLMYVMDKNEYYDFTLEFSTTTTDSAGKNGGAVKTRLRYETPRMREWLDRWAQ